MSLRYSLALVAALLLYTATPAHAVTVNLFGNNTSLGLVSPGQTGFINNKITIGHEILQGAAFGYLPANSTITFSYTFTHGAGKHGHLDAAADYHEKVGNLIYNAHSEDPGKDKSTVFNTITHKTKHVPSPILATADMTHHKKSGITTITNNSDVTVSFSTYFITYFSELCRKLAGHVFVTYQVSSVPLPASLVMFMTGLMALGGLAYGRKMRQGRLFLR